MNLMPLNCTLKVVKMANFILCTFYYDKNIYKMNEDWKQNFESQACSKIRWDINIKKLNVYFLEYEPRNVEFKDNRERAILERTECRNSCWSLRRLAFLASADQSMKVEISRQEMREFFQVVIETKGIVCVLRGGRREVI